MSKNQLQKTPSAQKLSRDPARAMQEMMDTINDLKTVYVRETEALNGADAKAFLEMQGVKLDAARKYQEGVEEILSRRNEMNSLNPLVKKRLLVMQEEFADLGAKNLQALKRMQRAAERLGQIIRTAAKNSAHSQRPRSYGETGAIHGAERKTVSMGVSETA